MAEILQSQLNSGDIQKAQFYTEHYIRQALDDEKYESSCKNAYSLLLVKIALDNDQEKEPNIVLENNLNMPKNVMHLFISTRAINNEAILHLCQRVAPNL